VLKNALLSLLLVLLILVLLGSCPRAHAQSTLLSEYKTEFSYRGKAHGARAANIKLAAQLLDGVVIQPNELFSFNKTVGPRTEKQGFKKAKVIFKKRLRKDFGGGVCQAASTLHAVFLYAGLDIVEHSPHSRASSYIQPSLDATVIWGVKDLQVKNTYPFPVKIVTDISIPGIVHIALYGSGPAKKVTIQFQILETENFDIWKVARADWKLGRKKVQEPGTLGYKLYRIRYFQSLLGTSQEERLFLYPPSRRIIIVGTLAP
jgi:vancomycin resistance protein YoaR